MTTVFYGDDFQPTAWDFIVGNQPTWEIGVLTDETSTKIDGPFADLIGYTLYEDISTFEAWQTWALVNRVATNENNFYYYGTYAMAIKGTWPVLTDDDAEEDTMCIYDVSDGLGAICIQTVKADTVTKTYNFTKAAFDAAWTAMQADIGGSTGAVAVLDVSSAQEMVVGAAESGGASGGTATMYEGFQKWYCEDYSTGVELNCRAWMRSSVALPKDDPLVDPDVIPAEDGYPTFYDG